jgi:protein gp37
MAQDSKIEWTHHTANLWSGCTKVHEGCDNCYAETLSHRWAMMFGAMINPESW